MVIEKDPAHNNAKHVFLLLYKTSLYNTRELPVSCDLLDDFFFIPNIPMDIEKQYLPVHEVEMAVFWLLQPIEILWLTSGIVQKGEKEAKDSHPKTPNCSTSGNIYKYILYMNPGTFWINSPSNWDVSFSQCTCMHVCTNTASGSGQPPAVLI